MKPIVAAPNPVLTSPARPVAQFDKKLASLVRDMTDTLLRTVNPKGVGLAAPQIGVSLRVFITRPRESTPVRVFINPEILSSSSDLTDGVPERGRKMEGCLSIPRIWGKVRRAKTLTLRYQDINGAVHREPFSGFLATIIQHETDHINGILFTRRVLEQKGTLYEPSKNEEGKEVLREIKLTP
ncbi:peptide deformylase [Patescibacteria group bacterium]|nr:peptide deformylase [Patescibacteria group bacterium]